MNTEIIAHPILQHVGIATPNLDDMLEWYRKVLGMAVNKRVDVPAGRAPFTAVAFASNDEINHRVSFFETPGAAIDAERSRMRACSTSLSPMGPSTTSWALTSG